METVTLSSRLHADFSNSKRSIFGVDTYDLLMRLCDDHSIDPCDFSDSDIIKSMEVIEDFKAHCTEATQSKLYIWIA